MIIHCSACQARFRLDRKRVGGKRLTLRCVRCGEVFKITVPAVEREPFPVLVAHGDPELCVAIGGILDRDSIPAQLCHHSDQVLRYLKTGRFPAAVIDVALPGLFAFQLVEEVKGWTDPRPPKIILLSSVYNRTAYKRHPSSLYGADDYIEKHHIGDRLVQKILRMVGAVPATLSDLPSPPVPQDPPPDPPAAIQAPALGAESFLDEINQKIRGAEEHEIAPAPAEDTGARVKAERLARIIVSDIALYNQALVDEGVVKGTFFDLLAHDIDEGRRLFRERFASLDPGSELLQKAFQDFIEKRRGELLKHSS